MKLRTYPYDPEPVVVVNGRRTRNFICLVDAHRRASRQRPTAGRYRVGAKNAKQARKFLQKAIGFGSVLVYYEDGTDKSSDLVPYGQCMKETYEPGMKRYAQTPAKHATAPVAE